MCIKNMGEDFKYLVNEAKRFESKVFEVLKFDKDGYLYYDEEEFDKLCNYLGMGETDWVYHCDECNDNQMITTKFYFKNKAKKIEPARLKVAAKTWLYFGENGHWGLGSDRGWIKENELEDGGQLFILYALQCWGEESHSKKMRILLEVKDMKVYVTKVDVRYIVFNSFFSSSQ